MLESFRAASPLPATPPGILRMAGPLVVSFWMRSLFTFVDTFFAARLGIGDAPVAAIGLSIPFEFVMIAVWVGLSSGLTSNLSRAMGARAGERIEQYLAATRALVWWTVPFFLALGAACVPLAGRLSPDPATARQFAIYGSVLIGGSALSMFWSVIPDSIVKAHNDTRSTMWAGIWSNLINVALNTLFTFVFHWGIFGIAFSTIVGRFGGLVYALRKASAHEERRRAKGETLVAGKDRHPIRAILSLALPAAAAYGLMAAEAGIINRFLATLDDSTESLAAYAIQYRVLMFVVMPAIALSVAMLPYAARRFGAGDIAGIRQGLAQAHRAGIAYLALATPLIWFGAPALASSLTDSPVTARLTVTALRLIPAAALAAWPFFLCRPVFEGLGRGRPGLVMAFLRHVVLLAPAAWGGIALARGTGLPGLYGVLVGLVAAAGVASCVFLLWTRATLASLADSPTGPARLAASES